jgi:hypothetical protein
MKENLELHDFQLTATEVRELAVSSSVYSTNRPSMHHIANEERKLAIHRFDQPTDYQSSRPSVH